MSAVRVKKVFDEVIESMQHAARELRGVDAEQAHALLADSIAMQARAQRFMRALSTRESSENDNA